MYCLLNLRNNKKKKQSNTIVEFLNIKLDNLLIEIYLLLTKLQRICNLVVAILKINTLL